MKRVIVLLTMFHVSLPLLAFGASYSVSTNAQAEGVLDAAIAAGGSHDGLTKQQVLQRAVASFLRNLNEQQTSADLKLRELKIADATNAARQAATTALLAGITAPQVTNPGNQSSPANTPLTLSITATDADERPLTMTGTNLPPGLTINGLTVSGTPTTPGTYAVTLTVRKYPDGSVTTPVAFSWVIS